MVEWNTRKKDNDVFVVFWNEETNKYFTFTTTCVKQFR